MNFWYRVIKLRNQPIVQWVADTIALDFSAGRINFIVNRGTDKNVGGSLLANLNYQFLVLHIDKFVSYEQNTK